MGDGLWGIPRWLNREKTYCFRQDENTRKKSGESAFSGEIWREICSENSAERRGMP